MNNALKTALLHIGKNKKIYLVLFEIFIATTGISISPATQDLAINLAVEIVSSLDSSSASN